MRSPRWWLLVGSILCGACSNDLFHATKWHTLCEDDPQAAGCPFTADPSGGGGLGGAAGSSASSTGGSAPTCDDYCANVQANCTGTAAVYADLSTCLGVCAVLPTLGTLGNTLACRATAAVDAATDSTRCPAAGPGGADECGTNCDGYCTIMTALCSTIYTSVAACAPDCSQLVDTEPFSTQDTAGATLQCHLLYATQAAVDQTNACPLAGPTSTACQ